MISYGAALYIQRKMAPWHDEKPTPKSKKKKVELPWKVKLQKKIDKLRKELSILVTSGPLTKSVTRQVARIQRKYKITDRQIRARIAEHQAEIKGLAAQIKNKEKRINTKIINSQFATNPRKVYRELINETIEVTTPPEKESLENFWRPLYETEKIHQEHDWIETITEKNENKAAMRTPYIDTEIVKKKITQYGNYKTPGVDKVTNYWLKKLNALHPHYACSFQKMLASEEETPDWLTLGSTSLLPKSQDTHLPNKYRPICCLSTTYKLLTGIISDALYDHLDKGDFLEEEQKGCIRNRLGTKHQLLINKTILEDCKRRQRNLSIAWIDYQKAFDSVPHSWISRCLELYKVDDGLRTFLTNQMTKWTTNITLRHNEGEINIPNVKIRRGIYQGDSLSPLLFCLTLDPLSKLLKSHQIGYNMSTDHGKDAVKKIINHLLFMDDLKLYADSDENLTKLVQIVEKFSKDIHMDFGLEKCSKCTMKQGKKVETENIQLDGGGQIADLESDSTYKYLGIEESATIQHKHMRKKITEEYLRRVKKICKSDLTTKNKVTAINQLAVPAVTYGFGIVDWHETHLSNLDVKTRKCLTLHKVIYRNQCLDRMYLPRIEGGLGLTEISTTYRASIVSLGQYIISSNDHLMKLVADQHRNTLPQNTSVIKLAKNFGNIDGHNLIVDPPLEDDGPATTQARFKRLNFGLQEKIRRKERWKQHKRAGKFMLEMTKK